MKRISWFNQYKIIRQHIIDALVESRPFVSGNLLDIGCGTKPYKDIFKDVVKDHIGTDYPSSISANKEHKNVEVYSILPHMPFKNESFDTVLATEVLEHISDPSAALKEVSRVLKKDGILILTAPQSWGLHETPHDYYRYTKYGLSYLAEKNDFEVIYIIPLGGFFALIGQRLSAFTFYFVHPEIVAHITCAFLQFIFTALDKLIYIEEDTLGNIMVAQIK